MAFSMQGGGASRSARRRVRHHQIAEINVTPLVDVMLVLLIIFMVAAPLLTVGVPIDLPQEKSPPLKGDKEPLTVSINRSGQIFLQETTVTADELVPRLLAIAESGYDERIYVRGDRTVEYGTVMSVMARLSSAGFTRIGLVNETPGEKPKR